MGSTVARVARTRPRPNPWSSSASSCRVGPVGGDVCSARYIGRRFAARRLAARDRNSRSCRVRRASRASSAPPGSRADETPDSHASRTPRRVRAARQTAARSWSAAPAMAKRGSGRRRRSMVQDGAPRSLRQQWSCQRAAGGELRAGRYPVPGALDHVPGPGPGRRRGTRSPALHRRPGSGALRAIGAGDAVPSLRKLMLATPAARRCTRP